MGDRTDKISLEDIIKNLDKIDTFEKKIEYLKAVYEGVSDEDVKSKIKEILNVIVKRKNMPRVASLNLSPIHTDMEEFSKPVTTEKMERPTIIKEVQEEKPSEKAYTLTSEMVNAEYQRMDKELTKAKRQYETQEALQRFDAKIEETPMRLRRQNLPGINEGLEALKKEQEIYKEKEIIQKYKERKRLTPGEVDTSGL